MAKNQAPGRLERRAAELRELASRTAKAALSGSVDRQTTVLDAAEQIDRFADNLERRAESTRTEPAIAVLPANATADEVRNSRRRQAIRRGSDVYLPSWSAMAQALPNAFLRSALFSTGRSVQANNARVLSGDSTLLVAGKEIASFRNMTLTFSGYELCQFDRLVYATCLDYYREAPLCPEESPRHVRTTFYEFARRMGNEYSVKAHRAIRASLLRLSFAQMRLRYNRMNIEVPKLLSVTFEDGELDEDFKGSDALLLRVTTSVADLFGPGAWTAVDKEAVRFDGLRGWLASFYAGHAAPLWLPVERLYLLSGYTSHRRNFKASLVRALEQLMDPQTPACSRVARYDFSKDGTKICVVRSEWSTHCVN
ncbi:TrfA family protein [Burkholderia pseudomallei]|uniref:plasmid replication initiator TrfA n=1 Tax=Burkholderia pseudomallei TaxID=28450 RepID=UPI002939E213|nr:TrfA family protein [Burkholderia pseudomallei]CAJ2884451.1 TrfA family protein [Burkholderia pseudomallei]CAJ9460376.1 TrfA family protein [Burkholderia pseudomallei]CAK0061301.1 TrfA family protein [Burkholderia pseudomallei]